MSRTSSLWQRKQNGFWYTKLNGRQVKLSKDKAEARRLLHKLLAADEAPAAGPGVTCRRLLDTYLARTAAEKSAGRVTISTRYLARFCTAFGHRRADAVKPYEVSEWLEGLKTRTGTAVSVSTRAAIVSMLRAGFNFGVREGYLPASPMKGVKKGKWGHRERMLTPAEIDAVVAASPHREFLTVLRLTGMRPFSEAAALTAAHLDPERRRAVFTRHKTAEKTKKPRVVYFAPGAWEIVARRAERYPTGLLFRNRVGDPITCDALNKHLREVCQRVGVKRFPVYCLRHFQITTALGKGVPIEVVAHLIGNSPQVIRENYSKLGDDVMADVLAAAARAIS